MSAPAVDLQNAKFLNYGFLATRAKAAAKRLECGEDLTGSERDAIDVGIDFLKSVSTGASYLEGSDPPTGGLLDALDALDLAIDPVTELSKQLEDNQEIGDFLAMVASAVERSAKNPKAPRDSKDATSFKLFELFFDSLYRQVSQLLERDEPVIGKTAALRTVMSFPE